MCLWPWRLQVGYLHAKPALPVLPLRWPSCLSPLTVSDVIAELCIVVLQATRATIFV